MGKEKGKGRGREEEGGVEASTKRRGRKGSELYVFLLLQLLFAHRRMS
mgnify:CR=1 FL=1